MARTIGLIFLDKKKEKPEDKKQEKKELKEVRPQKA